MRSFPLALVILACATLATCSASSAVDEGLTSRRRRRSSLSLAEEEAVPKKHAVNHHKPMQAHHVHRVRLDGDSEHPQDKLGKAGRPQNASLASSKAEALAARDRALAAREKAILAKMKLEDEYGLEVPREEPKEAAPMAAKKAPMEAKKAPAAAVKAPPGDAKAPAESAKAPDAAAKTTGDADGDGASDAEMAAAKAQLAKAQKVAEESATKDLREFAEAQALAEQMQAKAAAAAAAKEYDLVAKQVGSIKAEQKAKVAAALKKYKAAEANSSAVINAAKAALTATAGEKNKTAAALKALDKGDSQGSNMTQMAVKTIAEKAIRQVTEDSPAIAALKAAGAEKAAAKIPAAAAKGDAKGAMSVR